MRDSRERVDRLDVQVRGLHGSLRETANDVILIRDRSPIATSLARCSGTTSSYQATAPVIYTSSYQATAPVISAPIEGGLLARNSSSSSWLPGTTSSYQAMAPVISAPIEEGLLVRNSSAAEVYKEEKLRQAQVYSTPPVPVTSLCPQSQYLPAWAGTGTTSVGVLSSAEVAAAAPLIVPSSAHVQALQAQLSAGSSAPVWQTQELAASAQMGPSRSGSVSPAQTARVLAPWGPQRSSSPTPGTPIGTSPRTTTLAQTYWERLPNGAAPPPQTMAMQSGSARAGLASTTQMTALLQGQQGPSSQSVASLPATSQCGSGTPQNITIPLDQSPQSAMLTLADTSVVSAQGANGLANVTAEGGPSDAAAIAAAIHAAAWQGLASALPGAAVPGEPAPASEAAAAFAACQSFTGVFSPSQSFLETPSPRRHMMFASNSAGVLSSMPSSASNTAVPYGVTV